MSRFVNDPKAVTSGHISQLIANMPRMWPEDIDADPIGVDCRYVPRNWGASETGEENVGAYARIYWRDSPLTVIATCDRDTEEWTVVDEASFLHTVDKIGLPIDESSETLFISMSPDNVRYMDDIAILFGLDQDEETHRQFVNDVSSMVADSIVGDLDHSSLEDDVRLTEMLARRRESGEPLSREEMQQAEAVQERLMHRARLATMAQDMPNSKAIANHIARQLMKDNTDNDDDLNTGFYL